MELLLAVGGVRVGRERSPGEALVNLAGQEVELLAAGFHPAGTRRFRFDGTALPSGVYFCRLTTPDQLLTRKMLLVR